jgi:plasmid stabilization system protein ParE
MKPFKASGALPADLQHAFDYFLRGGERAASQFIERYEMALRVIGERPGSCRLRPTGWRQKLIMRSSFAIFYRETPEFWLIGGVVSLVRDPDTIQAELLIRELGNAQRTG